MPRFRPEYQCELLDIEEDWNEAVRILCRAHIEAENFKRTLPHVKGRDGNAEAYPHYQFDAIEFARETFEEATKELKGLGMDAPRRRDVKKVVSSMSSEEQARVAGLKLFPLKPREP